MKMPDYEDEVKMPTGVSARMDGPALVVKGKNGELKRRLAEPGMDVSVNGSSVVIKIKLFTKRHKTKIGTMKAHIRNMFKGVSQGHVYKLKVCSGHFPMNVAVTGNQLVVKNFIGEKIPRTLDFDKNVKVKLDGQVLTLESHDKELAGTTASEIEHLTRRANYDRRVFQDGIYITEKDGKPVRS
jgi:large subunit ribosomal protein L6